MFENNTNKDYIIRIAEHLSEVIINLLNLRKQEKDNEIMAITNDLFDKLIGGSELIDMLSYDAIIDLMYKNEDLSFFITNCIGIADILKIRADIIVKNSSVKAYNLYQKALNIYLEIVIKDNPNKEQREKIIKEVEEIIKILNNIDTFNHEQLHRFFVYYEKIGYYGKSEDYLYMMLNTAINENSHDNVISSYIREGEIFYKNLLEKNYNDLLNGNLPIDEVKDGFSDFLKKFDKIF